MNIVQLHNKIEKVAPIFGISIGDEGDKSTWVVQFADNATDVQKVAAQDVITAFDPNAPEVPKTVTPYQARMALLNAGLLDNVEALIADPTTPKPVKLAWDWATIWERDSPFIAQLGGALKLTDAQVDALFVAAAGV